MNPYDLDASSHFIWKPASKKHFHAGSKLVAVQVSALIEIVLHRLETGVQINFYRRKYLGESLVSCSSFCYEIHHEQTQVAHRDPILFQIEDAVSPRNSADVPDIGQYLMVYFEWLCTGPITLNG